MIGNLFKNALIKNETEEFFRRASNYFVRSWDFEGHVHGANISGSARVILSYQK